MSKNKPTKVGSRVQRRSMTKSSVHKACQNATKGTVRRARKGH